MILVTGSTGLVGGSVVKELLATNAGPVRVMVRNEKDETAFAGKVETVQADFADSPSLDRALQGVDSAYLVCAAIPQLVEFETNFLMACKKADTKHVVMQSALGAADFPKSFPSWHRKVEDKAAELGIPRTILRPNGFMQNVVTYTSGTIKAQDCFYDALGEHRISHIDVRDIAAAAAKALVSASTIGQVYELSGPEALSGDELAAKISTAAGRTIRYVPLTPDQMLQGMLGAGMPETAARPVVELYEYYRMGKGAASDQSLRQLLGREPRRIDAYLAENAAAFAK